MRAVVYCRISDDRSGARLGVNRQERECRGLAERNGWDVAEVLVDNDLSAYRAKRRPAYVRLLEGLDARQWDAVVCWHPDRLHRRPVELEGFIDVLERTGAQVATVTAGHWDLTTPSGRLVARQLGAVARYESEHKAERQRAKHDELFRQGKPSGGDRAFGYQPDLVTVNEEQAALIRWAADHLLAGGSLRSVCKAWNDAGARTSAGNLWRPLVARRLLSSARLAGKRERGGLTVDAVWEPIVEWETTQRLRALFADPARRSNLASRRYLLTGGLAVCGVCSAPLIARPRSDKRPCYVCATGFGGCGRIRVLAEPLESDVTERFLAGLSLFRLTVPEVDTSLLVARLDALEAHQAELAADFYAHRTITRGQFTAASGALGQQIAETRSALVRAEGNRLGNVDAVERWDDLDIEARRLLLRWWLEAVVVSPAIRGLNRYDDRRVRLRWSGPNTGEPVKSPEETSEG